MKAIIIEDELLSAERLQIILERIDPNIVVVKILPSVNESVAWLSNNDMPDLLLMDIHLSDQSSFEIFKQVEITAPIIFTTAYDQYAIQAFKHNSIDYLLKPIDPEDLGSALTKLKSLQQSSTPTITPELLNQLIQPTKTAHYKERFLVKKANGLKTIPTEDIAYIKSEDKVTIIYTNDKTKDIIDQSLDKVEALLDPQFYFRINRHMIIRVDAILNIHNYLNGRLKLDVQPSSAEDVFVSRDRVNNFKAWLDQ